MAVNFSGGIRDGGFAGASGDVSRLAREVATQQVNRQLGTNFSAGNAPGGPRGEGRGGVNYNSLSNSTRDGGFGSSSNVAPTTSTPVGGLLGGNSLGMNVRVMPAGGAVMPPSLGTGFRGPITTWGSAASIVPNSFLAQATNPSLVNQGLKDIIDRYNARTPGYGISDALADLSPYSGQYGMEREPFGLESINIFNPPKSATETYLEDNPNLPNAEKVGTVSVPLGELRKAIADGVITNQKLIDEVKGTSYGDDMRINIAGFQNNPSAPNTSGLLGPAIGNALPSAEEAARMEASKEFYRAAARNSGGQDQATIAPEAQAYAEGVTNQRINDAFDSVMQNVAKKTVPDAPASPSANVDDFMMRRARELAQRRTAPAPISSPSGTPMSGADAEVARLGLLGDNFGMSSFEQAAPVTTPSNEIVSVRDTGKGYNVVEFADGHTEVRTGARNWRNNNPGNIEYGSFAKSQGAIGSDGRFAIFPTYDAGRAAKESLLFDTSSYKDKTIAEAINRYAPPSENNTNAYIGGITSSLGVPANTRLSSLSPAQRSAMLDAMERIEGFRVGTVQSSGAPNAVDATQLAASNALASGGLLGGNADQFAQAATPILPPRTPTPEQTAVNQAVTPGLPPRTPTPRQQVADAVVPAAPPMAPSGRMFDTIPVRTDRQPAVIETPVQDAIGNMLGGILGIEYGGYPNAGSARLGWDTVMSDPTPYSPPAEDASFWEKAFNWSKPGNLFPYAKDVNPIEGTPEGQYIQQTETGPLKGYIDVPYRYEAMDKPVYGAPGVPDGWTAPIKGASVITFKDGGGVWKHPSQGWQPISQFRGSSNEGYANKESPSAQREVQVASELNADEAATTGSTTDTASSMLPQWYLDWLASQGSSGGILA